MTSAIQALLTPRYGNYKNPFPSEDTLAADMPFTNKATRSGRSYNYPIRLGISHGLTLDNSNTAVATNGAISGTHGEVTLDGATIVIEEDVAWNDVMATMNGIRKGVGQNGDYMKAWDNATESTMLGAELWRELQILCGPGSASTAAASLGTVANSVSGADLAAGQVVNITAATWRNGLWPKMKNALVDILQSDGSTSRETAVTVTLTATTSTQNRITLTKAASAAVVATGDIIIPRGGKTTSCYGIEAIAANAGSLFGISAATDPQWKVESYAVSGSLNRDQILGGLSQLQANGLSGGGTLYVNGRTLTDLIVETLDLQRFSDAPEIKKQGAGGVMYKTPIGDVTVKAHPYFKQSYAFFNPKKNGGIRIGSTDNTFSDGTDQFPIIHLPSNLGMRIRMASHQAVLLPLPWHCMQFTGIDNVYDTDPA